MAKLEVFPVILTGGIEDSKAVAEAPDLQELENFTLFRGRFALRAPCDLVASPTSGTPTNILALEAHLNKVFFVAFHSGTNETRLWSMDPNGSNLTNHAQVWSGASMPMPVLASFAGGTADAPVNRLYISDWAEQYNTVYWNGSAIVAVTEDLDDSGAKENLKFNIVAPFQYHLWGFNFWRSTIARPEVGRYSRPGLIAEDEPDVTNNINREWWSIDYRPFGKRGEIVTAVGYTQAGMLIFKEFETHLLFGYNTDTWQSRVLSPQVGCVGPYATAWTEDGYCYWWSREGPAVSDGQSVTREFANPVKRRILEATADENTVVAYSPTDNLVYFIYSRNGSAWPNHWLAYDTRQHRWSEGYWRDQVGDELHVAGNAFAVPRTDLPGPEGTPGTGDLLFYDTYEDADATDIRDHIPDYGGDQGYTQVVGVADIFSNQARILANTAYDWQSIDDVVYDDFTAVFEATRNDTTQRITSMKWGLLFRGNGVNKSASHEALIWEAAPVADADDQCSLKIYRNAGLSQGETTIHNANYSWPLGESRRMGVYVTGDDVYCWIEELDGSNHVDYSVKTFSTSYNDSGHARVGCWVADAGYEPGYIDNHRVWSGSGTEPSGGINASAQAHDTVELTWDNSDLSNNVVTEIYRDTSTNPTTKIGEVTNGIETYLDETCDPRTTYFYRVRHLKNGQYSPYSANAQTRTWCEPITVITAQGQESGGVPGVQINFTNPLANAEIRVERRLKDTGVFQLRTTLTNQSAGALQYIDSPLPDDTFYDYRLRVEETSETASEWSRTVTAKSGVQTGLTFVFHSAQVDFNGIPCNSKAIVGWVVTGGNPGDYVKIYRHWGSYSQTQIGFVPITDGQFVDALWYVTSSSATSRNLYYTVELWENGTTLTDTDTTTPTGHQVDDCYGF